VRPVGPSPLGDGENALPLPGEPLDLLLDARPPCGVERRAAPAGAEREHHLGRALDAEPRAPRLLGLRFDVAGPNGPLVGVEQVTLERVQGLALVELPGDLAAVGGVGEVAGGVDGAPQRPYSFKAAASAFCRSDAESLPTSRDAVASPNFNDRPHDEHVPKDQAAVNGTDGTPTRRSPTGPC
jgi:hypothetical protein